MRAPSQVSEVKLKMSPELKTMELAAQSQLGKANYKDLCEEFNLAAIAELGEDGRKIALSGR